MNIFSSSIRGIVASPFRSFSIAAFIAVFTLVSLISLYFTQITESYETFFIEEYGCFINIWTDYNGKGIEDTLIESLRSDEHITEIGVVDEQHSAIVYVDDKDNLPHVEEIISNANIDGSYYRWESSIEAGSEGNSGVHAAIANMTKLLITITNITSLLILILMTYLWMRKHYNEAGIYIALGRNRIGIMFEFALEIIIISVCSIALFTLIGSLLIATFGESMVLAFAQFNKSNYLQMDIDTTILSQSVNIETALRTCGTVIIIVLVSTFISGISILKHKATDLFVTQ